MQNLTYHAALHGIGRRSALERANDLLARVGLADRAEDKIRKLSGGQMRRVEIARALLHRPRLLLLDEPTVGLDIRARADILSYVRSLVAEEGVSVLWATHLVDEVSDADTVAVLHHGHLLAHGPMQGVVTGARAKDIGSAFTRLTESKAISPTDAPSSRSTTLSPAPRSGFSLARYAICLDGIVWRETLRFLHQRERFIAALVRPLVWLFIFAVGFRQVLGVSIIPPYELMSSMKSISHQA